MPQQSDGEINTASEIVGKCTPALWHDAGEAVRPRKSVNSLTGSHHRVLLYIRNQTPVWEKLMRLNGL